MRTKDELVSVLGMNVQLLQGIVDGELLLYTATYNDHGTIEESRMVKNSLILELILKATKEMLEKVENVE